VLICLSVRRSPSPPGEKGDRGGRSSGPGGRLKRFAAELAGSRLRTRLPGWGTFSKMGCAWLAREVRQRIGWGSLGRGWQDRGNGGRKLIGICVRRGTGHPRPLPMWFEGKKPARRKLPKGNEVNRQLKRPFPPHSARKAASGGQRDSCSNPAMPVWETRVRVRSIAGWPPRARENQPHGAQKPGGRAAAQRTA